MKSLAIITIVPAGFFSLASALLILCGVRVHAAEPLAACLVAIGAGIAGLLPIVLGRRTDPVGIFQLAMTGTVLHLIVSVELSAGALATRLVTIEMSFTCWLLAGYSLSLTLLIWQLRRALVTNLGISKGSIAT